VSTGKTNFEYLITIDMSKSKDSKKNVKKDATKTPKEKKAEKKLKKFSKG
jgi:hypothetical protein